jgi:hypothetical protein
MGNSYLSTIDSIVVISTINISLLILLDFLILFDLEVNRIGGVVISIVLS